MDAQAIGKQHMYAASVGLYALLVMYQNLAPALALHTSLCVIFLSCLDQRSHQQLLDEVPALHTMS